MKNILKDIVKKIKSLKINLIDGQRKGEVIFRRVFLILIIYALLYLGLRLITNKPQEQEVVEPVGASETVLRDGDVVNGQKIDVADDGTVWYIQELPQEPVADPVRDYIKSYGGRINDEYLATLRKYCNEDTLRIVVAISVSETSMGKNTKNGSNFYGYFYGGNRKYDPSYEEMSRVICNGVSKYYMNIGKVKSVTAKYTGNDRVDSWTANFNTALEAMR